MCMFCVLHKYDMLNICNICSVHGLRGILNVLSMCNLYSVYLVYSMFNLAVSFIYKGVEIQTSKVLILHLTKYCSNFSYGKGLCR